MTFYLDFRTDRRHWWKQPRNRPFFFSLCFVIFVSIFLSLFRSVSLIHTQALTVSLSLSLSLSLSHTHTHTHIYIYIYIYQDIWYLILAQISCLNSTCNKYVHTKFFSLTYHHSPSLSLSLSLTHTHTHTHTISLSMYIIIILLRVFQTSVSQWFSTRVWVTASLLKYSGRSQ